MLYYLFEEIEHNTRGGSFVLLFCKHSIFWCINFARGNPGLVGTKGKPELREGHLINQGGLFSFQGFPLGT